MKRASLIAMAIIFLLTASGHAAERRCKSINQKKGKVYTIKAALHKATHIQLPERLMLPPEGGDRDLWDIAGQGHHVMVKPNSAEPQGAKTNLVLVTESNTAYHFELVRVPFNQAYSCVEIKDAAPFFKNAEAGNDFRGNYRTREEMAQMDLEQQILSLEQALAKERKMNTERIDAVISKYRSMIYTRYSWSEGMGFKGSNLITDVWDDGRFTFIRVKPDHRGMLAAKAEIDGKEEMLEYKPDSEYMYKISGIFPKFTLVYGEKNKVTVKRKDNQSNGVY